MKTFWAVVDLSDTLPTVPYVVTRFRWYARWIKWWLIDEPEDKYELVIMPWTPGSAINHD